MTRLLFAVLAAAVIASPVLAQEAAAPACAAVDDSSLPPALSGWLSRTPLTAAQTAADAPKAALPMGRAVDAQLKPNGDVAFAVPPGRPGAPTTFGGLFEIPVEAAGDYQVSLAAGAWIEVVRDGAAVASTSHAHGPACSSLKKTVVFPLVPGRYLLEIAGNTDARLPVMVSRVAR